MQPVRLARGIHLHEIRVIQRSRRLRLAAKARDEFLIGRDRSLQSFQRDEAIQRNLTRLVHRAHPALPKPGEDFKFAEGLAFDAPARGTLARADEMVRGEKVLSAQCSVFKPPAQTEH